MSVFQQASPKNYSNLSTLYKHMKEDVITRIIGKQFSIADFKNIFAYFMFLKRRFDLVSSDEGVFRQRLLKAPNQIFSSREDFDKKRKGIISNLKWLDFFENLTSKIDLSSSSVGMVPVEGKITYKMMNTAVSCTEAGEYNISFVFINRNFELYLPKQ